MKSPDTAGYMPENKTKVYQIGDNMSAYGLIMAKKGGVASMDEILDYIESTSFVGRDFTEEYISELRDRMRQNQDFSKLFEETDGGYKFIGDSKGRENMIAKAQVYLDNKGR